MTPRKWLGIVFGVSVAFAVFWFGYDLISWIGGRRHERSQLTVLLLTALIFLIGVQAGAQVGWGNWAGDSTFSVERWMWSIVIAAALLVLSVATT